MRPKTVLLPVWMTTPVVSLIRRRHTSPRAADHQSALKTNIARLQQILVGRFDGPADRLRLARKYRTVQLEIGRHVDEADICWELVAEGKSDLDQQCGVS